MRISSFSDYSVRVLMYLGFQPDRLGTTAEIASAYGISENHLTKVVSRLARSGFIETVRGKGGGMRLARSPEKIVLGEVVRHTEVDFNMVECFSENSTCRIFPACCLHGILDESLSAMLAVLDRYTLADLLVKPKEHHKAISWRTA